MVSELCRGGEYTLQCFPRNDPGIAFSVLVGASGSHRTTGYRACFSKADGGSEVPVLSLRHERTEEPELQMLTEFQVAFAFKSSTNVNKVKVIDAKGEHVIEVQNLPTLIATCPA